MSQAAGRRTAGRSSGRARTVGRRAAMLLALLSVPALLGGSVLGGSASAAAITASVNLSWTPYKACPGKKTGNCAAVRALTRTPNGTIFLGGDFTSLRSSNGKQTRQVANLAALNDAGQPVTSVSLPRFDRPILSLVNDGSTVYAGGSFTSVNGTAGAHVARFSATTGARLPFAAGVNGDVYALALMGPGLYIGGHFSSVQGVARQSLAALNSSTGAIYTFFAASATLAVNQPSPNDPPHNTIPVRALLATSNRLYVAGDLDFVDGWPRPALAAVNPLVGSLDGSFQPNPLFVSSGTQGEALLWVPAVGTNPASVILSAGGLYNYAVRVGMDGTVYWAVTGDGDFQTAATIGRTVYFGGHFTCISPAKSNCFAADKTGTVPRMHIAAFPLDGFGVLSPDPSFTPWMGPDTDPYFYGVQTLISAGTSLYAGGVWKSVKVGSQSYAQAKYVRFGPPAS